MSSIKDVLAVIMAGGRGTRLHPLTQKCSKPAVPIGGKYRLIDIPISNCINSGINRIAVLTQFNSASLHRHITNAYQQVLHGNLQILAASQTPESEDWYQGTADAMRKQLAEICNEGAEFTLVLAGDHVYRMDYEAMVKFHMEKQADITVAVHPVGLKDVRRLGILKSGANGRVTRFVEKPDNPTIQQQLINDNPAGGKFLGSMGIYIFNTSILENLLIDHPEYVDFGGDVLPAVIESLNVYAYEFNDYWEDIGTVRSYYEANLAFTRPDPPFDFYSNRNPIYSNTSSLPSSKVIESELTEVILAEGCVIRGARISHSVIGLQSHISQGTRIKDSIIMGVDQHPTAPGNAPIAGCIGEDCLIEGAILDKNVRIGNHVLIQPFPRGVEMDGGNWFVCDGIVVIPRDIEIADGTVLAPVPAVFNQAITENVKGLRVNLPPAGHRIDKNIPRYGGRYGK